VNEAATKGGIEGFLKKRGGINLHSWQTRWFELMGNDFNWREKATDSFSKGSITLSHLVTANINNTRVGGENHTFTLTDGARHDAKRKREFACETGSDAHFWVDAIEKSINTQAQMAKLRHKKSIEKQASMENGESNYIAAKLVSTILNTSNDSDDDDIDIGTPDELSGWYVAHTRRATT